MKENTILHITGLDDGVNKVLAWAEARGIFDPVHGSKLKDQVLKLGSEFGELCDNANKGRDVRDDIGDCLVVLINCAELAGLSLLECLNHSYGEIKDRKGQMVNGVFVKEGDLAKVMPTSYESALAQGALLKDIAK